MSYLKPKVVLASLLTASVLLASTGQAIAQDFMRSDSYWIQLGTFTSTSGTKSGGGYRVTDTIGQTAAGAFTSSGYHVFAGFQYIYTIPRFTFRILGLEIDLGVLSPGTFNTSTNQLVISTRSGGYSIQAAADSELRQVGGTSAPAIPHTDCDSGCDITTADVWNNALNPGFGFNVTGTNASADFLDGSYFRPFADREALENPQVIASHNQLVRDDVLTITYKAVISGTQAAGTYQTSIDYIAVPTY